MRKVLRIVSGLSVALISSCTSTTLDEFRQGETGLATDESIVILGRRQSSDYETRTEFVECVGERMGNEGISVISEQPFIDALFPWFEPRSAPMRPADLGRILEEPSVAEKVGNFGVRYIVWIDGQTEMVDSAGTISCTISPGGAGCFGGGIRDFQAQYEASVWDVANLTSVGNIAADATGTTYIAAVVVPFVLPARVEPISCDRLASQLAGFIMGE